MLIILMWKLGNVLESELISLVFLLIINYNI